MSIVEDDEVAQKKGFTNLTYAPSIAVTSSPETKHSDSQKADVLLSGLRQSADLMSSLPVRVTGYHYCTDNPALQFVLSMVRMALGKDIRLRIRSHLGMSKSPA